MFDQHRPSAVVIVQDQKYLIRPPRHTFHSRLIYAPAAAALVTSARLDELGPPASDWIRLPRATGTVEADGTIVGEVVHVDRFGNLVTNIDAAHLPAHPRIVVGSTVIDRLSDAYSDVDPGGVLAIVGSTGKLELSINRDSAAKKLFVSRTDPVRIETGVAQV